MTEDNFLDEFYRKVSELEILQKQYLSLVDEINLERNRTQKITSKDIMFDDNRTKKSEKKLEKEVVGLIGFCEIHKQKFEKVILTKDVLSDRSLELLFEEISKMPEKWKSLIETIIGKTIDSINNNLDSDLKINHFYSITENLPNQFFSKDSIVIKKMVEELSTKNKSFLYAVKYFLWHQDYRYPIVINGFTKNLKHEDWRIRIITHQYLKTWKSRYKLEYLDLPDVSFIDKAKSYFYRNFESKLIDELM